MGIEIEMTIKKRFAEKINWGTVLVDLTVIISTTIMIIHFESKTPAWLLVLLFFSGAHTLNNENKNPFEFECKK